MTTPALSQVNTFPAHSTQVYVVTILSVGNGHCSVDPGDGEAVAEVPYFGAPLVGSRCPMLLFDGQLAVLGLAPELAANPALVASAGWSVTSSSARWDATWGFLYFNVTRTGTAIPGATRGNITNSQVGTLATGVPSASSLAGISVVGGSMLVGGALTTDRLLNISFSPPTLAINTGDTFNGSVVFPL